MKKVVIFFALIFFSFYSIAQQQTFFQGIESDLQVKKIDDTHLDIYITLGQVVVEKKSFPSGDYLLINNGLVHKIFGHGEPMLPQITRMLDIPAGASIKIKSLNYEKVVIDLDKFFPGLKIVPATPSQRKDGFVSSPVPDEEIYNTNAFVNNPLVSYNTEGWLRSYHLATLTIRPFDYNPLTNELVIYKNIQISLEYVNSNWEQTRLIKQRYSSPAYNFDNQITTTYTPQKSLLQNLPLKLIIVYPDEFLTDALLRFKQWKERQGFDVVLAPLSQIGSDTASIRSWLKNYYETASHPQDFILFVGDVGKVPSWPQRTRDQHVSDLYYCEYTGDYLPEVYWGRISADDTTELWNAINKILAYEQLDLPSTGYLNRALLIAGNDESFEDTYGNGQIRYINTYYLNADNGYEAHTLYQDPPTGANYSDTILDIVNKGCALANYTAHCSPQGWADPSFTQSTFDNGIAVNNLYGVWVANCCQSNKFDEEDAFSEVALHTAGKGVAAYIGASDYSYWDEDYWWAIGYTSQIVSTPLYDNTSEGAFDGYFHTKANEADPSTWYITTAQMVYAGNMAVQQSNSSLKQYYWEIYQVMGDPTLVPFIGTPEQLVITPYSPILRGTNKITLQTSPYTYITVYQNNIRIGTGITDSNGVVSITTNYTIFEDSLTVYAWGQNKVPTKTILQTTPNIPLVETQMLTTVLYSNSADTISFVFANSTDTATIDSVFALFQVLDQGLAISTDSVFVGSLPPNTYDTVNIPCSVDYLKDLTKINMLVRVHQLYDTTELYLYNQKYLTIYSPDLQIVSFDLFDQNNNYLLDANESAQVKLTLYNKGHADLDSVSAKINIEPQYATITPDSITSYNLKALDTLIMTFDIACQEFSDFIPAQIKATVNTGQIIDSAIINTYFGQPQYVTLSLGQDTTANYPFNNYWENGETQILLTKDEIKFLGIIDELGFRIVRPTPGGYKFLNLKIGFYQQNIGELTSFIDPQLFTTVYEADVTLPDQVRWYYFHTNTWQVDPDKDLVIYITWGDNGDYVPQNDAFAIVGEKTSFTSVLYKNYDILGVGSDNVYISYIRPAIKIGKSEISEIQTTGNNRMDISIYPNPTTGILHFILPNEEQINQIQILSLSGRIINTKQIKQNTIDISQLQPGIYLLRITTPNNVYTTQVIKQ